MPSSYRRGEFLVLVLSAALVLCALIIFGMAKLRGLGYNALDFAIFENVLSQSAAGHLFQMTIHPHSYLGDHVSPFLLLLVPLFRLLPRPETLVVIQCVAVMIAVWPLALLAERLPLRWRYLVIGIFLLQPLVHNLAIFEFELVVFALPLLLTAGVAYMRQRYWLWLMVLVVALTLREDIGLVLIGWALLALLDRRSLRWWLPPLLLGIGGFIGGVAFAAAINHEQYKFLSYYGWLGATPGEAIQNIFMRPWQILLMLFRLQNLLFVGTLLLMTGGMALLRLRRLLPALFVLLALLLTSFGGDAITLRTHYPALILPFLLWASIEGIERIHRRQPAWMRNMFGATSLAMVGIVLSVVAIYGFASFSPLRLAGINAVRQTLGDPKTAVANAIVTLVPAHANVAASYGFLSLLANRPEVYSLHYAFSGHRQLSQIPYRVPDSVDTVAFDTNDALFYDIQFGAEMMNGASGDERLRELIGRNGFSLTTFIDSFLLFQKKVAPTELPLEVNVMRGRSVMDTASPVRLIAVDGQDEQLHSEVITLGDTHVEVLPINLVWELSAETTETYRLVVDYVDSANVIRAQREYALGYGIWPASSWDLKTPMLLRYRWIVPTLADGRYSVRIHLERVDGYLSLDAKLSAVTVLRSRDPLGPPVTLGTLDYRSR